MARTQLVRGADAAESRGRESTCVDCTIVALALTSEDPKVKTRSMYSVESVCGNSRELRRLAWRMASRVTPIAALLAVAFACDRARPAPDSTSSAPAPSATLNEPTGKAAVASPRASELPAPISPDEARNTLDVWVKVQNEGNFEAYQRLYASKFTGTKRVGAKQTDFAREGWLRDRQQMFAKPFTVGVSDVEVYVESGLGILRFTQTWKSDTFEDHGRKELYLMREAGVVKLTREAMLDSSSTRQSKLGLGKPVSPAELVLAGRTAPTLLLQQTVNLDWAAQHPVYVSEQLAERAVTVGALPKPLQERLTHSYEVFDQLGARCLAKPTGYKIFAHVVPHFGTVNFWNDFGAESEGRKAQPLPNASRALGLWGLAQQSPERGLRLAMEFAVTGDCGAPQWGREVRAGAPEPWRLRDATKAELELLNAALPQHPALRALDNQLAGEFVNHGKRWLQTDKLERARTLTSQDGRTLYIARVNGEGGCGYTTPETVHLIWRKHDQAVRPVERAWFTDSTYHEDVVGAVDLDGTGESALLTSVGIYVWGKGGYERLVDDAPLYLDCPC